LLDHPDVKVSNCSPRLIARWGLHDERGRLAVPVTHRIPAGLMGSGLGRNDSVRGDYDIQMFDAETVRRHQLGALRFGDLVAIVDADNRFGRSYRPGFVAIGCVVHGESTVAGHGPGVATLLTGPQSAFSIRPDPQANIAGLLNIRPVTRPRRMLPLAARERRWLAASQRPAISSR
jgi:hypothetical protein